MAQTVQNFFCLFKRLSFNLHQETNFNNYNLITMKKNLLLLSSLAVSSMTMAQFATSITEDYTTAPCHAAWQSPGLVQGNSGDDITAAAYVNNTLQFTVTDNVAASGPWYYPLTNDVTSNCANELAKGRVDISGTGHNKLKIRAKASAATTVTVYIQEGNAPSWNYAKFSNSFLKMNLTTSYQDFEVTGIVAAANPGTIDLTNIGGLAFEMLDAVSNDVHFSGTVTIESIKIGEYGTSVNELSSVSNFTLFPSPASSEVNLTFTAQEATTVTLTDITGRVMVSEQASAGSVYKSYDVSGFAQGLYFVTISGANGQTTEKFMVK